MNFIWIAIICICFLSTAATNGQYDGKSMMCVIDLNSTIHSNGIALNPDLNLCTHLICSDSSTNATKDSEWKIGQRKQYKECINSRTRYPHLKILYSVEKTTSEYSELVGNSKKRREFIKTAFNLVSRNNFDGLNLNLSLSYSEPRSTAYSYGLMDRKAAALFLKELNEALKTNNLMLIVSILKANLTLKLFDFASISKYVDNLVIVLNEDDDLNGLIKSGVPSKKIIIKSSLKQFVPKNKIGITVETRELLSKYPNSSVTKFDLAGASVDVSIEDPKSVDNNGNKIELKSQNWCMDHLVEIFLQNIKAVVMLFIELDKSRKSSLNAYNKAINRMTEKMDYSTKEEINSAMETIKYGFKIYQQVINLYTKIYGNRIDVVNRERFNNFFDILFKTNDKSEFLIKTHRLDENAESSFKLEQNSAIEDAKHIFEIIQLYVKTFSIIDWNESRKKSLNAYSIALNEILDKVNPCSETDINTAVSNIKNGLMVFQHGLNMFSETNDATQFTRRSMPFSVSLSKAIGRVIKN